MKEKKNVIIGIYDESYSLMRPDSGLWICACWVELNNRLCVPDFLPARVLVI